jgi:hypothetical protein
MPTEREIEREIDPQTGRVTKTVTESLGEGPGETVITTTTYDAQGGVQMKVKETYERRPANDPRARPNLVRRETAEYAPDGRTVQRRTTETFGGGVNETRGTKLVEEWVVDPERPGQRRLRFVRNYHWVEGRPGRWQLDTTVELDEDGRVVNVTHS